MVANMKIYGRPIMRARDLGTGAVIIEGHNGIRYRITKVDVNANNWAFNVLHMVPLDNPLPEPRGNATGRGPTCLAVGHILGLPEDMLEEDWRPSTGWRFLADPRHATMDTETYAREMGFDKTEGIVWHAYDGPDELPPPPPELPLPYQVGDRVEVLMSREYRLYRPGWQPATINGCGEGLNGQICIWYTIHTPDGDVPSGYLQAYSRNPATHEQYGMRKPVTA